VHSGFRDDVGVEAVAEVDGVNVVTISPSISFSSKSSFSLLPALLGEQKWEQFRRGG
jgi:hypothetical protein